jgi:hypothetical protein
MIDLFDKNINLRSLDDEACSIFVVARQIRKMINKFPALADTAVDCRIRQGHYTRFQCKDDKFIWHANTDDKFMPGCEKLTHDCEILYKDELNKLLVTTFRDMCDSQNGVDLADTPEDILAYAESVLQEMLKAGD